MLPEAASIMPPATAFATAKGCSPIDSQLMNMKGKAPKPVVMQVSHPYKKTLKESYPMRFPAWMQTMKAQTPTPK
eukprot:CAMPEP_0177241662 /NCGR_PEP_ID=MMETSP0367-20130122/48392_1 /TAXON_ID=447022 ORGANISM="Scrippsiella hangoei-like, Strain SHHI-4" /NCGR_SAMPLE_ID=MMETSP0367 /ASSEMBLY_ACC=CAM_ASM_000362 /LENGTH=74 /DNA_ID=CAMNT_0018693223 /DNA_START=74 /DNA_END=295 /DNA_ORIENTATION=-